MECPTENCNSRAFDVRAWKNTEEIPEGAAVCRECDTRVEITMSKSELKELQEPLDQLEAEIEDLQDELNNLRNAYL